MIDLDALAKDLRDARFTVYDVGMNNIRRLNVGDATLWANGLMHVPDFHVDRPGRWFELTDIIRKHIEGATS